MGIFRLAALTAVVMLLLAACSQPGSQPDNAQEAAPRIEVSVIQGEVPVRLDAVGIIGRYPTLVVGASHRQNIASLEYRFADTDWQSLGVSVGTPFTPTAGLPDGPNRLDVRATSTGGRRATVSIPFTVDAIAPSFTSFRVNGVESVDDGSVRVEVESEPAQSILVQAAASDPETGTRGVRISVRFNGEEVRQFDGGNATWQLDSTELAIGLHAVEMVASDGAGNLSEVQSFLIEVVASEEDDASVEDPENGAGDDLPDPGDLEA